MVLAEQLAAGDGDDDPFIGRGVVAELGGRDDVAGDLQGQESPLILVDIGWPLSRPREPRGARNGSQRVQTPPD